VTTTALLAPEVSLVLQGGTGGSLRLVDEDFNLQLDEGAAPFFQAGATVQRPDDATYALLDPTKRTPITVSVALAETVPLTGTMFVYERVLDPEANTVAIKLVSREYDLITYSPFNLVNQTMYQSSVRTLCQRVILAATGSTATVALVGGASDKTFRVFSAAENLALNPKLGVNATGWTTVGTTGGGTVARGTNTNAAYPFQTYARLELGTDAAVSAGIAYTQAASFTAGEQYTFMIYGNVTRSNVMSARLIWSDNTGAEIGVRSYAASRSIAASSWQRFVVNATAPANAANVSLTFYAGSGATAWSSGDILYATAVMIVEGDGTDPTQTPGTYFTYFDGVTADTIDYHYGWADVADASASTRTPLVQRDPETLWWTHGVSAYDFLKPILDAVGLRLFLREDGQWCLADNGYTVDGQVAVQFGVNLYDGQELLSIGQTDTDGFPMNADAVILNYAWTDPITGAQKTATDSAVSASYKRPYVADIDQPYPGPGQAKFLLARLQARKYSITATARPDWTARPGMSAFISLANRPAQTGYVQALEFDLSSGQMTVTSKGLITALDGSVGHAPIDQTIGAVSGTIAAYTN
jgi:hypothetical protein